MLGSRVRRLVRGGGVGARWWRRCRIGPGDGLAGWVEMVGKGEREREGLGGV